MTTMMLSSGVDSPDDEPKLSDSTEKPLEKSATPTPPNSSFDASDYDTMSFSNEPSSSTCNKRKLTSEIIPSFEATISQKRPCSAHMPCLPAKTNLSNDDQLKAHNFILYFLNQGTDWQSYVLQSLVKTVDPTLSQQWKMQVDEVLKRDVFTVVPWEVARMIASYLPPEDLRRATQVSTKWRMICKEESLWRKHCKNLDLLRPPFNEQVPDWWIYNRHWIKKDCNCGLVLGLVCHSTGSHHQGIVEEHDPEIFNDHIKARLYDEFDDSDDPSTFSVYMKYAGIMKNWIRRPLFYNSSMRCSNHNVITCMITFDDYIVTGSDDNTLIVWSIGRAELLRTLTGHYGGVWSLAYSPPHEGRDIGLLISGSTDRTAKVWNPLTGEMLHTLFGHTSTVRCLAVHGDVAVSGSRDNLLRSWDIVTGASIGMFVGHMGAVRCVKFDGKRVISGSYDHHIRVWDAETFRTLFTLAGHSNRVYSLAVDWERNILASGSLDTTVRVWNLVNGSCIHELRGHSSLTSGLALRGNTLISSNADGTCVIWDIQAGLLRHRLGGESGSGHSSAITGVRYLKSGLVITSSDDGSVKLWDANTGRWLRNLLNVDTRMVCIWRVECTDSMLIVAVGSRPERASTRVIMVDFNVPLLT